MANDTACCPLYKFNCTFDLHILHTHENSSLVIKSKFLVL